MKESIPVEQLGLYANQVIQQLRHGNLNPVLTECVPEIHQAVRDCFNSSATPDNEDWPPRKIEGDGHPLLVEQGDLMQAATGGGSGSIVRVTEREIGIGVDLATIPYARAQNLGYPRRNLPPRRFLGLNDRGKTLIGDKIADYILETVF